MPAPMFGSLRATSMQSPRPGFCCNSYGCLGSDLWGVSASLLLGAGPRNVSRGESRNTNSELQSV